MPIAISTSIKYRNNWRRIEDRSMEKKSSGTGKRTKREIGKVLMVINIKQEIIDILQIANRRFMYNPKI